MNTTHVVSQTAPNETTIHGLLFLQKLMVDILSLLLVCYKQHILKMLNKSIWVFYWHNLIWFMEESLVRL